jgi:hypothetical protein
VIPSLCRFRRVLAFALAIAAAVPASPAPPTYVGPIDTGTPEVPPRHETSGIATSHRGGDYLWVHDDSGGDPALYAVTPAGKTVGSIRLKDVRNDDWEDVASFQKDGKAWLLIADTGDNDARRRTVSLHLVEEPPVGQLSPQIPVTVTPAWTMRMRYEDGPRDCESVAVDAAGGAIYLLTKRDDPPRLYRIDLAAGQRDGPIVIARFVGEVPNLPEPTAFELFARRGRPGKRHSEITAMDFAPDGSAAAVLTYGAALLFERKPGESWATALARQPVRLPPHNFLQAEAICFSADGKSIYVAAEGLFPLTRYDRQ